MGLKHSKKQSVRLTSYKTFTEDEEEYNTNEEEFYDGQEDVNENENEEGLEEEEADLIFSSDGGDMTEMFPNLPVGYSDIESAAESIAPPLSPAAVSEDSYDDIHEMNYLTIDQDGGSFNIWFGISLEVPKNAVLERTRIPYKVSEIFNPDPKEDATESLSSYVVQLHPSHLTFNKPISINMMHSSGSKTTDQGFEKVVKSYDSEKKQWKVVSEFKEISHDSVQTMLTKPTAVAVVSRLITDTFEVPVSGCDVRSSVCRDVILHFPKGAVDRTIKGSMKVLPMPNVFPEKIDGYPCALLVVDGFEGMIFTKAVTIEMPHPFPEAFPVGQVHLMRLKGSEWEDISNERGVVCRESKSTIELCVPHFSILMTWVTPTHIAVVALAGACVSLLAYVFRAQTVFFAALKDKQDTNINPKVLLFCVANNEQERICEMKDQRYNILAASSSERGMRPNAKAYGKISESVFTIPDPENFHLSFIKGQKYRKELEIEIKKLDKQTNRQTIESTHEMVSLSFYEDESKSLPLCKLSFHKHHLLKESETLSKSPAKAFRGFASAEQLPFPSAPIEAEAGISRSTTGGSDESNDHDTDDRLGNTT